MKDFSKNNFIKNWWRNVDQQTIIALSILILFSLMLVTTTSPAVAEKIGLVDNYFSSRQAIYLTIASFFVFMFSSLDIKWIKRLAILGFLINLAVLVLVKFYGYEVKGATRWIRIAGFSYQPSEFIKPFFSVVTGWILSLRYNEDFPSFTVCGGLYIVVATLLIIQPDFGMLVLVTAVFSLQLFVAGLPFIWIILAIILGLLGTIFAYLLLPHVATRINSFLDPAGNEAYQVTKSILAFEHGGLYGRGPGEGSIKQYLPDSHTDFIFAVAGEEFGAIICLILICIFAFIVLRTLLILKDENNKFIQLATIGLIAQFGLQATINMGVTLNLLPTKGMTLPFISYGGSSTLAISLTIGMVLGLTKRKTSLTKYKQQHIDI
ncbi:MAG: putative peptidoglycan glycosyltransferase FtsW [Rickettsiaceae bacterium]|nr:putative peptidoglycan glycosyltransferase FtsW [Rickettsiaceae bacterium]